jgi:hypothetical protein
MPDTPSETDIEARAQRHHYRSLTPEEYEGLNRFRADWADLAAGADDRFFILGSFAEDDVDRVDELKAYVNEETDNNSVAYRMDDFLKDDDIILHPILKFKLIADDSHHILGVCEHSKGGQLIEHGLLIESRSYIEKTHILKRAYPTDLEKERYSWMQTFGVFEIFEYYDQLYEWKTVPDYQQQVEDLVDELL